jgi:2-amino-4-hydroxy-6-hydroxymethyldihydropteridine diphosphokinase
MNHAYLLTGGNVGDRAECLREASGYIERQIGEILRRSALYETAPWGQVPQPSFLNQVLLVLTALEPAFLMQEILSIEQRMGRIRGEKYGPRTIDIDILFYDFAHIDQPDLKIPHPAIPQRRFVLVPMDELAPDFIHPVLHKSIHELLMECTDPLDVKKI